MPSKLAKPHLLCLADTGGPTKYFKGNLKEKVDKATAAGAHAQQAPLQELDQQPEPTAPPSASAEPSPARRCGATPTQTSAQPGLRDSPR